MPAIYQVLAVIFSKGHFFVLSTWISFHGLDMNRGKTDIIKLLGHWCYDKMLTYLHVQTDPVMIFLKIMVKHSD